MSIDKLPIRVGSNVAVEPTSQLPMFRKFLTFEANRETEIITVFYQEWLESNGRKLELKTKKYIVVDQPEINHIVPGNPNAIPPTVDEVVIDVPAYPMFTDWLNKIIIEGWVGAKLGVDIIIGSINTSLIAIPFNAPDGYKTTP